MSTLSPRWVSWSTTRFFFVAAEILRGRSGENSCFSSILWYYIVFTNCNTIYIIMIRDDCIAYNISTGAWSTHSLMAAPREEAASAVVGFVQSGSDVVICPARWNLLSRFHHPDLMRLLLVLLILTLVLALLTHSTQGATEDKFWVYSHCILNFILHFSFFLRCDVDVEPRLGGTCSSWAASLMATRASPWRWTDTEHQIFRQERYQQTTKQRKL